MWNNEELSGDFSILFFSTKCLCYKNEFLPIFVHINELKLSGALKEFSITSQLLGSKMQTSNF